MQAYTRLELSVGTFVLAGGAALVYLAVTLGEFSLSSKPRYPVTARFSSVGDLKVGDPVKMAGVPIGEVKAMRLTDFVAEAELSIEEAVVLPEDTIASIQSAGLLGDAYVALSPGASERDLPPGGRITRSEPAISITELISKYAFGSPIDEGEARPNGDGGSPDKPSPFSDPLE